MKGRFVYYTALLFKGMGIRHEEHVEKKLPKSQININIDIAYRPSSLSDLSSTPIQTSYVVAMVVLMLNTCTVKPHIQLTQILRLPRC